MRPVLRGANSGLANDAAIEDHETNGKHEAKPTCCRSNATGGVGELAGRVGLKQPSLYKILSQHGNPTLASLQEILKPLGLRISVALDKAA